MKGTIAGEQRGAVRLASGQFRTDRGERGAAHRRPDARAGRRAGQELTYTCVPPGSGTRIGVDRDEDGFFDRDELDAGSDPADPASVPGAARRRRPRPPPARLDDHDHHAAAPMTLIQTTALKLTEKLDAPGSGKVTFKSSTKKDPVANRIVLPPPGGPGDPRIGGATLTGLQLGRSDERLQLRFLAPPGWKLLGSTTSPKGYRYRGKDVGDSLIKSMTIKADGITVKGFSRLHPGRAGAGTGRRQDFSGATAWCADAPAKDGHPPSTAKNDRPGKFTAQPKTPAPGACPPEPGSPSGRSCSTRRSSAQRRAASRVASRSSEDADGVAAGRPVDPPHAVAIGGQPPERARQQPPGRAQRRQRRLRGRLLEHPEGQPELVAQPRRQQPRRHHAQPLPRRPEPPRRRAQQEVRQLARRRRDADDVRREHALPVAPRRPSSPPAPARRECRTARRSAWSRPSRHPSPRATAGP